MTSDSHISEIHSLYAIMKNHEPYRFLSDIRQLKFKLSEEAQAFSANLFKNYALKYVAIVCCQNPKIDNGIDGTFDKLDDIIIRRNSIGYFKNTDGAIA